MPGPIVVGVDGSEASFAAVRWAAATAARQDAPLHLVHAIGVPLYAVPLIGSLMFDISSFRRVGESALEQGLSIARRLVAPSSGVDVQTFLDLTSPVAALAARSAAARLLVVGARGLDPVERVLLGSVGVGLIKHAGCPVAVIPAAAETTPPSSHLPVLVGVDGSRCSARAVEIAFEEAASRNTGLVAVTTRPDRDAASGEARERAERLLEESLADCAEKYPSVCLDRVIVAGRPEQRLLEAARHAQLVVLGSRGRGGITGAALGSVSQAVLQTSRTPVIVVPCRR
ncbi:universal stress protein [Nocardia asteroides]